MLHVGFSFYKIGVWYVGCWFDFDSDLGNMLVSVSILTQTWVICWFRFRFWLRLGYYVGFGFDFDSKNCEILHIDFNIESELGNMLILVSILIKKDWYVECWFDFDSDLNKMLVSVSILTQTWTKCWFWFRFWQKRMWYVVCWFRFWLRLGQIVGFGLDFDSDWEKVLVLVSILTNNLVKCNMLILT